MSLTEVQRFSSDLDGNANLRAGADAAIAGMPVSLDGLTAFAVSRGYEVTIDDVRRHVHAQASEGGTIITDDELDNVSGGVVLPMIAIAGLGVIAVVATGAITGVLGYLIGNATAR